MRIIGSVQITNCDRVTGKVTTSDLPYYYNMGAFYVVPHMIRGKQRGWAIYMPHIVSSFLIATKNHKHAVVICRYLSGMFDVSEILKWTFSDFVQNDDMWYAVTHITWRLCQNNIAFTCNINYAAHMHITGRQ